MIMYMGCKLLQFIPDESKSLVPLRAGTISHTGGLIILLMQILYWIFDNVEDRYNGERKRQLFHKGTTL